MENKDSNLLTDELLKQVAGGSYAFRDWSSIYFEEIRPDLTAYMTGYFTGSNKEILAWLINELDALIKMGDIQFSSNIQDVVDILFQKDFIGDQGQECRDYLISVFNRMIYLRENGQIKQLHHYCLSHALYITQKLMIFVLSFFHTEISQIHILNYNDL